jgi:hypothetical protein
MPTTIPTPEEIAAARPTDSRAAAIYYNQVARKYAEEPDDSAETRRAKARAIAAAVPRGMFGKLGGSDPFR